MINYLVRGGGVSAHMGFAASGFASFAAWPMCKEKYRVSMTTGTIIRTIGY
jgi:hypothetical protein